MATLSVKPPPPTSQEVNQDDGVIFEFTRTRPGSRAASVEDSLSITVPPDDDTHDGSQASSSPNHISNPSDSLPSSTTTTATPTTIRSSMEAPDEEEVIFVEARPSGVRPPPLLPFDIDVAAELGDHRLGVRYHRPAADIPESDIINLGSDSEEDKLENENKSPEIPSPPLMEFNPPVGGDIESVASDTAPGHDASNVSTDPTPPPTEDDIQVVDPTTDTTASVPVNSVSDSPNWTTVTMPSAYRSSSATTSAKAPSTSPLTTSIVEANDTDSVNYGPEDYDLGPQGGNYLANNQVPPTVSDVPTNDEQAMVEKESESEDEEEDVAPMMTPKRNAKKRRIIQSSSEDSSEEESQSEEEVAEKENESLPRGRGRPKSVNVGASSHSKAPQSKSKRQSKSKSTASNPVLLCPVHGKAQPQSSYLNGNIYCKDRCIREHVDEIHNCYLLKTASLTSVPRVRLVNRSTNMLHKNTFTSKGELIAFLKTNRLYSIFKPSMAVGRALAREHDVPESGSNSKKRRREASPLRSQPISRNRTRSSLSSDKKESSTGRRKSESSLSRRESANEEVVIPKAKVSSPTTSPTSRMKHPTSAPLSVGKNAWNQTLKGATAITKAEKAREREQREAAEAARRKKIRDAVEASTSKASPSPGKDLLSELLLEPIEMDLKGSEARDTSAIKDMRNNTLNKFRNVLQKRIIELPVGEQDAFTGAHLDALCLSLESALYKYNFPKYVPQYRKLTTNLGDLKNGTFYMDVLTGRLTPAQLAVMENTEMASEELKRARKAGNEKLVEGYIRGSDELNDAERRMSLRKTHKGENIVDKPGKMVASVPDEFLGSLGAGEKEKSSVKTSAIVIAPKIDLTSAFLRARASIVSNVDSKSPTPSPPPDGSLDDMDGPISPPDEGEIVERPISTPFPKKTTISLNIPKTLGSPVATGGGHLKRSSPEIGQNEGLLSPTKRACNAAASPSPMQPKFCSTFKPVETTTTVASPTFTRETPSPGDIDERLNLAELNSIRNSKTPLLNAGGDTVGSFIKKIRSELPAKAAMSPSRSSGASKGVFSQPKLTPPPFTYPSSAYASPSSSRFESKRPPALWIDGDHRLYRQGTLDPRPDVWTGPMANEMAKGKAFTVTASPLTENASYAHWFQDEMITNYGFRLNRRTAAPSIRDLVDMNRTNDCDVAIVRFIPKSNSGPTPYSSTAPKAASPGALYIELFHYLHSLCSGAIRVGVGALKRDDFLHHAFVYPLAREAPLPNFLVASLPDFPRPNERPNMLLGLLVRNNARAAAGGLAASKVRRPPKSPMYTEGFLSPPATPFHGFKSPPPTAIYGAHQHQHSRPLPVHPSAFPMPQQQQPVGAGNGYSSPYQQPKPHLFSPPPQSFGSPSYGPTPSSGACGRSPGHNLHASNSGRGFPPTVAGYQQNRGSAGGSSRGFLPQFQPHLPPNFKTTQAPPGRPTPAPSRAPPPSPAAHKKQSVDSINWLESSGSPSPPTQQSSSPPPKTPKPSTLPSFRPVGEIRPLKGGQAFAWTNNPSPPLGDGYAPSPTRKEAIGAALMSPPRMVPAPTPQPPTRRPSPPVSTAPSTATSPPTPLREGPSSIENEDEDEDFDEIERLNRHSEEALKSMFRQTASRQQERDPRKRKHSESNI